MSDKKVKISNILGSQIPDFIQADNPLFKEFLTQYYESEEREYGTTYLADHISSLKKISTVADISLVEKQTINAPNSNVPESPIILSSLIYAYDDTINVNETTGFPEKYGLLKIDNEIITYTGKTETSFTGCIRGFSGISAIETEGNPEFLTFTDTNAAAHAENSLVANLSFLFVTEFYKKFRKNFLPGLEGKSFSYGLNVENILSRARDFYSSKGTDTSLQILFQVLYGEQIEIIKPYEQTIRPSESEWDVTDDIAVEVLSGDPLNLVGVKIYQDSFTNPTASGAVSNVTTKLLEGKRYYQISFSKGTIENKFNVSTKTKVVGAASTTEVLTVDSTIGFGETGNFYYPNADNIYTLAEYTSKSSNQFFGCTGVSRLLNESDPIIDTNFVYGYEDNDLTKICIMRIVGSISGASKNISNTKYFDIGDSIKVKHLGEKYELSDKKFNTWFYNNISYIDTQEQEFGSSVFTTLTEHFLKKGDKIDLIFKDGKRLILQDAIVDDVYTPTKFIITGDTDPSSIISGDYIIKKKLNYASSNFGIPSLLSNIQNSFSDTDKNTYIAFSGYPSFDTQTTNRSKSVSSSGISTNTNTIEIVNHNFINGERVYMEISADSGISGSTSGYFYVNVVDNDTIRLTSNLSNLYRNIFEKIKYDDIGVGTHTITPASLFDGEKLVNQNNFKRIFKNPQIVKNNQNLAGPIGVSLNGIEYHSPISEDTVFYGQIDQLEVLNSGKNYDIVDPPTLSITDDNGNGCKAYANFSGSLSEIILNEGGFDYSDVPSVKITGGNGTGAICEAKMRGFTHSKTFTEFQIDLTNNTIKGDHRFLDGEEVTYLSQGNPIGVDNTVSENFIGFSTVSLSSGSNYFVSIVSIDSFRLAISKDKAINKTNLIEFNDDGTVGHTFRSTRVRKIIDRIVVKNVGSTYSNHKILVDSQQYPTPNKENLFKTFVGINTFNNYIYAKNHNFANGDVVEYLCNDTVISGLSVSAVYKVTIIDNNKFKLSNAGTVDNISNLDYNRKIYVNLGSVGVGTHTFKYPDIKVKIDGRVSIGNTDSIPNYYEASAKAIVKGGLKSIFIQNGGAKYGVANIVNYLRLPNLKLLTGKNGSVKPIIIGGKISDISILNPGSEYTSPPQLEVVGIDGTSGTVGQFAKLQSIVSDGKIIGVNIISQGTGYDINNTIVKVIPSGSEAIIGSRIHDWKINSVERYKHALTLENSEIIQVRSSSGKKNKLCSFYPPKKYRRLLSDNITDDPFDESTDNHSKILGWAYDGNPIYGPVSTNSSGITTFMEPSYSLKPISDSNLRPSGYQNGYFVQDYVYDESGDLDEHNGKFVKNLDFPNGTYAYFSTIHKLSKEPLFPYITFLHHNATDKFNYDINQIQSDEILNTGQYKRNVTHLGLNDEFRSYPLLDDSLKSQALIKVNDVNSSKIDKISVIESGTEYKVNDKLNFNDPTIDASVEQVVGKPIVSIGTTNTVIDNITFSVLKDTVTGVSTIPHGLSAGDIVEISGISSTNYKNIEGVRNIGVSTVVSGLSETMPNSGITTFVRFFDATINRKFNIDDVVKIDSEQLLVIDHDDVNNKYRLRRGHNSTTVTSHSAGSLVTRLETKFTYKISKKTENKNIKLPKKQYFEARRSVGIGTTVTDVVVGFAGSTAINKSIPPRAIYIPNHPFQNGDEVSLVSIGSTIKASSDVLLTNPVFDLADFDKLYCVRINNLYVGLATEKSGFIENRVFFKEVITNELNPAEEDDDNSIEIITDNLSGSLRRVNGTVTVATATTTGQQHGLSINDNFELHVTSNKTQTFDLRYNETIRKLVVNPITFSDAEIGIGITSKITINDHDFETGDLIVYNSSNPATPLVNNGVYYVIKDSRDTIRLAENEYDTLVFPYNYTQINTAGGSNHQISKINPQLSLYKNNRVEFLTSDSSLDNFDIEFFIDEKLKTKYHSDLITKTNDKIIISVTDLLEKEFYYKIKGKNVNAIKTLSFSVDKRVPNHSQIKVIDSKFNQEFTVTGIGTTTFKFNPAGIAETSLYDSTGISSFFYSTKSINETGGIHSVKLLGKGFNVNNLPIITSIGTTNGQNAILNVESDDIGSVNNTQVFNQGLEFSPDNTLKPKADSNVILELKNTLTLESIGIVTGGIDYTNPPRVLAIGKPNIVARTSLNGTAVSDVQILTNDSGLSEDLRIIPIINSNGVGIISATTVKINNNFAIATIGLRAPIPDVGGETGFYNNGGLFPFEIGDEIFVENVKTLDNINGYDSAKYDYTYFTVTDVNKISGGESISYGIVGAGVTGGIYQEENNFGRVIKKSDLAVFEPKFKKSVFSDKEVVQVVGKNIRGTVAENGWDPLSQTLKVFDVNGDFLKEDSIIGKITNNKSTVTNQFKFDFDLNVDSTANNINNWKDDIGKLNLDIQRLHDNDYYQKFSYSIKGGVQFNTWKSAVDSLDHVAGFKNFCNLGIISTKKHSLNSDGEVALNVDIDEEASVHEKFHYDMVSEDTADRNLSKLVVFKSKIITDYAESVTNKVLMIDDISSQFTGIVTSTGGGVIGTSIFNIFTEGDPLFHRQFDPSTAASIDTHAITIPRHNFNTGEKLLYKPDTGQSPIGIANTSDTNAGVDPTTSLPSTVFAIKQDTDNIRVAISATFASAGIGVSFTNVNGIGNINTLSVPSENATIRSLISIDNIIQSPVGISTVISVGLSSEVGISTDIVYLIDTSEILDKSLLKIDDEIVKVNLVGVGSTALDVTRGQMGTVAVAHTDGATVRVVKGDYRVNEGKLYFSEAPYGPKGVPDPENSDNPTGITASSTFSGRVFYRLNYTNNKIIDDISDRFDGSTNQFNLTSNNIQLTGISTSFGAILINNIFQNPHFGDGSSSILKSDYEMVGNGESINFTGTTSNKDLPRGGIINEFDVGVGTGYQVPRRALFNATVSNGQITNVGIVTGGAGYLTPPIVSVSSSIGSGAVILCTVNEGVVDSVSIDNGGSGYPSGGITTSLNFVTSPLPSPYTNIPLSGGNGSGAKIDVVVGTGGSIISFDMSDRGIGYEVGDTLKLTSLFHQVGIATTSFEITVRNKYQDKFAGWTFGQLISLDDFSQQFNGFKKSFLITRTTINKEYYSIVAQKGSGIILQNNLLIFINDVLQKPGKDYIFNGGTRIAFREAPRAGSKFKMYFYTGSDEDYIDVDVDETIKPGDQLRLQYNNGVSEQDNRIIYELIASDTVETTTYGGIGISTDTNFIRPTMWRKQTSDLIIDGIRISKERNYLEPQIQPTSGIIKSITPSDEKIYVKNSWFFKTVDDLDVTKNDITIVNSGTTPSVEQIKKVSYEGDYGIIVGIGTEETGIGTDGPAIFFEIKPQPDENYGIYHPQGVPAGNEKRKNLGDLVSRSGISTGDYFVIENTFMGDGVTGIKTTTSGPETVSIGNTFLDNVYYAADVVSVGSSILRVFANVNSIAGINTTEFGTVGVDRFKFGDYSWGSINVTRGNNSKAFTFHNQNGLLGIETSAQVVRTLPLKTSY